MSNKDYDNRFFSITMSALFILCFITLILTFMDYGKVKKEKDTLEAEKKKALWDNQNADYKLAQQVLDTIEDYYLVNKLDTKLIKRVKIEKSKIDTIIIKNGKQDSNPKRTKRR